MPQMQLIVDELTLKYLLQIQGSSTSAAVATGSGGTSAANSSQLDPQSTSKYQHLLSVIEEMSKDIRPTYAGVLT